jgi:hypothetical protein
MNERESVFCINNLQATFPPNIMLFIIPIIKGALEKRNRRLRNAIAALVSANNQVCTIGSIIRGNGRNNKIALSALWADFFIVDGSMTPSQQGWFDTPSASIIIASDCLSHPRERQPQCTTGARLSQATSSPRRVLSTYRG